MVKQVTHGVEISVQTSFLPGESSIKHGHYFFMYEITIENKNEYAVQLLSRHWHIYDSNGDYREVKGEGVIGEQPVIEPGQRYTYRSGCNLASENWPYGRHLQHGAPLRREAIHGADPRVSFCAAGQAQLSRKFH